MIGEWRRDTWASVTFARSLSSFLWAPWDLLKWEIPNFICFDPGYKELLLLFRFWSSQAEPVWEPERQRQASCGHHRPAWVQRGIACSAEVPALKHPHRAPKSLHRDPIGTEASWGHAGTDRRMSTFEESRPLYELPAALRPFSDANGLICARTIGEVNKKEQGNPGLRGKSTLYNYTCAYPYIMGSLNSSDDVIAPCYADKCPISGPIACATVTDAKMQSAMLSQVD